MFFSAEGSKQIKSSSTRGCTR